jgi:uncharacterized membrane protein YdjX (TVP38/TMEM64 family)
MRSGREETGDDTAAHDPGGGLMRSKVLLGGAVAVVAAAGAWAAWTTGAWELLRDESRIAGLVTEAGWLGPLVIVALMTVAVVLSPIPSAPVALAAGAAYGHIWGTVYVLIGAELGAVVAFGLARVLGYEALHRRFGDRLDFGLMGSQMALMVTVFVTRLLPFLSFDLVSYAAGLTPITVWRFALATLAGIVPASFVLAHFGNEMATGEADRIMWTALALGLLTAAPVLVSWWMRRRRRAERQRRRPLSDATPRLF